MSGKYTDILDVLDALDKLEDEGLIEESDAGRDMTVSKFHELLVSIK